MDLIPGAIFLNKAPYRLRPTKNEEGNINAMIQGDLEGSPSGHEVGENLIVRRTLCNKGIDEEPILRRNLFKTRCKMDGKYCKVIIDKIMIVPLQVLHFKTILYQQLF